MSDKCSSCNGSGKKIITTRIGLVTIPIMISCSNCNGTGRIKDCRK
ncbi:zinc finger domain-containing protein [Clostridium ihumii]|nr:zinc finger domain-containing protein [Clostridium ihumii]